MYIYILYVWGQNISVSEPKNVKKKQVYSLKFLKDSTTILSMTLQKYMIQTGSLGK